MLLKIKSGTGITVNGKKYTVRDTEFHQPGLGAGTKVKFTAVHDLDEIVIEFDSMTLAVEERDLLGLIQVLTTG